MLVRAAPVAGRRRRWAGRARTRRARIPQWRFGAALGWSGARASVQPHWRM